MGKLGASLAKHGVRIPLALFRLPTIASPRIAPVIERSGKSCWTHWRWNCPKFLRQTFHEFAKSSIIHSAWAHAYYDLQKSRGKGHNAAIRSLAFKWIRIIHRCWQTRTPYDEGIYLQALERRGSPLVALIAASTRVA